MKTAMTSQPGSEAKPAGVHEAMARGFTLIELLVVISLIVLLIAVLLPALVGAKRAAAKTQCASNLHQIGIAIAAYQSDTHGRFPQYWKLADCPTVYSLLSNNQSYLWGEPPGVTRPTLLSTYTGKFISKCPLDRGYAPGNPLGWPGTFYDIYGTSYHYQVALIDSTNGTVGDFAPYATVDVLWKKRLEEIKDPSRLATAGDITILYAELFTFPPATWLGYQQMHDLKTQELNLLFADSHVKATVMRPAPEHLVNEDYRLVP
jgi:prepilin-type N-terminal cleavage/methylation domain-containing protein